MTTYDPNFVPRDDASMAQFIAQQYEAQGIDPQAAYDDTEDALNDFGTSFR